MNSQQSQNVSPFETIRHVDEQGNEYWSARELSKLLGYSKWVNFVYAIDKAKEACKNSGQAVSDHFAESSKMVPLGSGAHRKTEDYHLTRYACISSFRIQTHQNLLLLSVKHILQYRPVVRNLLMN